MTAGKSDSLNDLPGVRYDRRRYDTGWKCVDWVRAVLWASGGLVVGAMAGIGIATVLDYHGFLESLDSPASLWLMLGVTVAGVVMASVIGAMAGRR